MNPASGNPCPVTVTFCTNVGSAYSGGSENYQWNFGGGTQTSGGALSGSANGPDYGGAGSNSALCPAGSNHRFYTVVYNSPGSYYPSVTIFSGGACATTTVPITICGALPVELLSFTGQYNSSGVVLLKWSTATESNNNFFTIERTIDGNTFEEIGRVATQAPGGNSTSQLEYSLIDENPVLNGTSYYRLKQTDVNGAEKTFQIISVTINNVTPGISIFPNPANESANIIFDASGSGKKYVRIYDNEGRIIREIEVNPANESTQTVSVDITDLNQGFYLVEVTGGDKILNGKLIRK
jgi:hypothetical protein